METMMWRPIETAPKDGTHVLVILEGVVIEAWFEGGFGDWPGRWEVVKVSSHGCGCCSNDNEEPMCWMPLPVFLKH
jgi:hypothetical protein